MSAKTQNPQTPKTTTHENMSWTCSPDITNLISREFLQSPFMLQYGLANHYLTSPTKPQNQSSRSPESNRLMTPYRLKTTAHSSNLALNVQLLHNSHMLSQMLNCYPRPEYLCRSWTLRVVQMAPIALDPRALIQEQVFLMLYIFACLGPLGFGKPIVGLTKPYTTKPYTIP